MNPDVSISFTIPPIDADFEKGDAADAFTKLFEQGALAANIGGWPNLEKLTRETSVIDQRAAEILKTERRAPNYSQALPESDEPLTDDSSVLAKRYLGVRPNKPAHRIEKSTNGRWVYEFDERGEMVAGHALDADEAE